jgi:hypothetical protein
VAVRKWGSLSTFRYKSDHFTKTGSGQTQGGGKTHTAPVSSGSARCRPGWVKCLDQSARLLWPIIELRNLLVYLLCRSAASRAWAWQARWR